MLRKYHLWTQLIRVDLLSGGNAPLGKGIHFPENMGSSLGVEKIPSWKETITLLLPGKRSQAREEPGWDMVHGLQKSHTHDLVTKPSSATRHGTHHSEACVSSFAIFLLLSFPFLPPLL